MQGVLGDIAPDFEFYSSVYHGTMGEAAFATALPDAIAEVSYAVWPRADFAPHEARIKSAVCAVADCIGNSDRNRTSYRAGDVSESYNPGFSLTAEASIRRWLANTGLLKHGRWI